MPPQYRDVNGDRDQRTKTSTGKSTKKKKGQVMFKKYHAARPKYVRNRFKGDKPKVAFWCQTWSKLFPRKPNAPFYFAPY